MSCMTVDELQDRCKQEIERAYQICENHFGYSFKRPEIRFDLRGCRAGVAYLSKNLIRLNQTLLQENGDDFIKDTPAHEAAHLINRSLYGMFVKPHGIEWAKIMCIIGKPANRCHDFEVKTDHVYSCKCNKKHYLSTTKHNRILSGRALFRCLNCNTHIKWDKLNEKASVTI